MVSEEYEKKKEEKQIIGEGCKMNGRGKRDGKEGGAGKENLKKLGKVNKKWKGRGRGK